MSLGETAILAVDLKLQGVTAYKSGITEAEAATAGLNRTVKSSGNILGGTASNLGLVKQAAISTGSALGGMGSHLKGVLTGPLGLLGLGAGLFTVAGLLKTGTEEASTFGLEVAKMSALTGLSVETTSALSSALDHFGISSDAAIRTVGMLEKNIGGIVNSKGGLAGFAKTFGLSLTDAKGNILDANAAILQTADYFNNKSIPATEKAAALAKLYGRQWQTLIPFLSAGRQGIIDAEQAAKDLGLTLTASNVSDLAKYRENFLTLGDAAKGLQLQLGLVLIPVLSDLARSFTSFLRTGGTTKIVEGFKSILQTAKDLGKVVTGTIIPTLQGLASTAKGFWDGIPGPLRDILVQGFVADRTIHFLLGVSPINLAKNLLGDIAGPIVRTLIANRLLPQPVIVVDGLKLPGGLPVGPAGGAGAGEVAAAAAGFSVSSVVAFVGLSLAPVAALVASYFLAGGPEGIAKKDLSGRQQTAAARGLDPNNVPTDAVNGMRSPIADWAAKRQGAPTGTTSDPISVVSPEMLKALDTRNEQAHINAADAKLHGEYRPMTQKAYTFAQGETKRPGDKDLVQWANAITTNFQRSDSSTYRSMDNLKSSLGTLEKDQKWLIDHGDRKAAALIGKDIDKLRAELKARIDAATRAAAANAAVTAARIVAAAGDTTQAIKDKDLNVTIPVSSVVNINGRLIDSQLARYSTTTQLNSLAGNMRGSNPP